MKYLIALSGSLLICLSTYNSFAQKNPAKTLVKPKAISHKETSFYWAGTLQKQGMTSYQYGTHILKGRSLSGNSEQQDSIFALKSNKIKLNRFIGKKVIITGKKVEGYPLESGPQLIEVSAIEPDKVVNKW